jgi:hypothetical protein
MAVERGANEQSKGWCGFWRSLFAFVVGGYLFMASSSRPAPTSILTRVTAVRKAMASPNFRTYDAIIPGDLEATQPLPGELAQWGNWNNWNNWNNFRNWNNWNNWGNWRNY